MSWESLRRDALPQVDCSTLLVSVHVDFVSFTAACTVQHAILPPPLPLLPLLLLLLLLVMQ